MVRPVNTALGTALLSLAFLSACGGPKPPTLTSIQLTCAATSLVQPDATTCTAVGQDSAGNALATQPTFTYTSSNTGVATISSTGAVTTVGQGTTTITATTSSGVVSNAVTLTVAPPAANGTVQINVKDALTQAQLAGVTFQLCHSTCVAAAATEVSTGVYNITAPSGTYNTLKIAKAGYISADYQNLNIAPDQTTILEQFLAIQGSYSGSGTVNGRITSATTGLPVSSVKLDVRPGLNNLTGSVSQSVTTTSTGAYMLSLPTGYYTVTGTLAGYESVTFTISVIGGQVVDAGDEVISPVLTQATGQWRFVLDWGATPYDLDSHLTGPTASGQRFHIYFADQAYSDALGNVNLDVDDTSSYGPETVTVVDTPEGLLRYYVHDYSNQGETTSSEMANSGARVRVYRGSTLMRTFNVPTGAGDLWTVFTLDLTNPDAPVLTPVNTVTTLGSGGTIQSTKSDGKQPVHVP